MRHLNKLLCTFACALPIAAFAQSSSSPDIRPADQPRTQLEKDQTTKNGQATQYGAPGTDTGGTTAKDTGKAMKHKDKKMDPSKSTEGAPTGAVSSYPAPTRDGTPTSPGNAK